MRRSAIQQLLREYDQHKGLGRQLFGNSRGIKELQAIFNSWPAALPNAKLSSEQMLDLQRLLQRRALRMANRADDYNTYAGESKLTNNIYQSLGEALAKETYFQKTIFTGPPLAPLSSKQLPFSLMSYLKGLPWGIGDVFTAVHDLWLGRNMVASSEINHAASPSFAAEPGSLLTLGKKLQTERAAADKERERARAERKVKFDAARAASGSATSSYDDRYDLFGRELSTLPSEQAILRAKYEYTCTSGATFDLRQLMASWTVATGLYNPYTGDAFSQEEIEEMKAHPLVGDAIGTMEAVMGASELPLEWLEKPLMVLFPSSTGDVFEITDKGFLASQVERYMEGDIEFAELMDVVDHMYEAIRVAIEVKQGLTEAEEDTLSNDPRYKAIVAVVASQANYTLDTLPKALFWQFAYQEFNKMLTSQGEKGIEAGRAGRRRNLGSLSAFTAIEYFDKHTKAAVTAAGPSGTIRYSQFSKDEAGNHIGNKFGNEYVVRMAETRGQEKGEQALKGVFGSFKGAFLAALRLDQLSVLFNKLDKPGICIGEKTRVLSDWRLTLTGKRGETYKHLHAVMHEYQDEITSDASSRSQFYQNMSAVNFILQRHQGESFEYKNTDGEVCVGKVTKELVIYYLWAIMGHEGLAKAGPGGTEPQIPAGMTI